MSRPEFCRIADCPCWKGEGSCRLKHWVTDGWPSQKGRNKQYRLLTKLAKEDPTEIIRMCSEIGLRDYKRL